MDCDQMNLDNHSSTVGAVSSKDYWEKDIQLLPTLPSASLPIKKRKFIQSTLGTTQSPAEEINLSDPSIPTISVLDVSGVDLCEFPKWAGSLSHYFKYVSVTSSGKFKKYKLQCKLCEIDNKKTFVIDKCSSSFTRHLEVSF